MTDFVNRAVGQLNAKRLEWHCSRRLRFHRGASFVFKFSRFDPVERKTPALATKIGKHTVSGQFFVLGENDVVCPAGRR